MARQSAKPIPTKRIWNPVTGSYYQIRQKTTSAGTKGTIIGKWSPPKRK